MKLFGYATLGILFLIQVIGATNIQRISVLRWRDNNDKPVFKNKLEKHVSAAINGGSVAPRTSFTTRMISGGIARCVAQAFLYPVDVLRTLAQTRDGRTLADVGSMVLLRGCFTTSSFALLMGSIQFSVYGSMRDRIGPVPASVLGSTMSCVVSVPQEVLKQRLVTNVYPSFRVAVASIFKEEGLKGFYSAWKPTVARNVPFVVTTFVTMDYLKSSLRKRQALEGRSETALSPMQDYAIGMSSAFIAGVLTNPIDVVKTRMMTQAASTEIPYRSALDCVSTILRKEGIPTFYAGFKQRSIYMCSLWGLTFSLNGKINRTMQGE